MDENEKKDSFENSSDEHAAENPDAEDYSFITEVIKKKPIDKRKILFQVGCIAGAAILFGVIAAITFVKVLPSAQDQFGTENDSSKIDLPSEAEPENDTETEITDAEESPPQTTEETTASDAAQAAGITLEGYKNLYADMLGVAEEVKKSMVTVIGITSVTDWFNNTNESKVQLSGLLMAEANNGQDLIILTEYRVVKDVERIQVTFFDGQTANATFQKSDPVTGLAIIKVAVSEIAKETYEQIAVANRGSFYSIKQGEPIIAIGGPMGYSDSVAYGVVTSSTNKISVIDNEYNLLVTDILGSGEGHGILVNLNGEVIGVIAQSYSSGSNSNIVTGLPISQITDMIEILSNNGTIIHAGITGQDITADISTMTGIPIGIWVETVAEDSPTMQAGIQSTDVIVSINDEAVETILEYHNELTKHNSGDTIRIKVMRQGAEGYVEREFEVTLGAL